jgi:CheY-like chemotaxis protein
MRYNFRNVNILVVDNDDSRRGMLVRILEVLGTGSVRDANNASDAYAKCQKTPPDLIIAELRDGDNDAAALAKKLRSNPNSPHIKIPILAIAGPQALTHIDAARAAGISDLLQAPYAADDIAGRMSFLLDNDAQKITAQNVAYKPGGKGAWPPQEESFQLTHLLLDHYTKHHEIVLCKLKFAHSATRKCIDDIRAAHQKVKARDNVNILEFNDFNKMWEDIITMFRAGGLSEDDISEVEKLITKMPGQIRDHYDDLNQQDKSFLTLVESLNRAAYKQAKERVMKLQLQPNPLNGKTSEDYQSGEKGVSLEAFFVDPKRVRPPAG